MTGQQLTQAHHADIAQLVRDNPPLTQRAACLLVARFVVRYFGRVPEAQLHQAASAAAAGLFGQAYTLGTATQQLNYNLLMLDAYRTVHGEVNAQIDAMAASRRPESSAEVPIDTLQGPIEEGQVFIFHATGERIVVDRVVHPAGEETRFVIRREDGATFYGPTHPRTVVFEELDFRESMRRA